MMRKPQITNRDCFDVCKVVHNPSGDRWRELRVDPEFHRALRVTTTTYGFRVAPSCAVTVAVIRLDPTINAHRFCAHTPAAFATTTAAFASLRVGVTTTDVTAFATLAA
jgi:hypothetical protein